MARAANISLAFATVPPICLLLLARGVAESVPAPIFVGLILLSPLAAAFWGHWALRRLKVELREQGRFERTKALVGTTAGYLEIFTLLAIIAAVPIHHGNPMAAHESSAVGSLRTFRAAARHYQQSHPLEGFPSSLKALREWQELPSVRWGTDPTASEGTKSGYRFTYIPEERAEDGLVRHYKIYADPIEQNITGVRHFFTDETGVIRYALEGPASAASSALQ